MSFVVGDSCATIPSVACKSEIASGKRLEKVANWLKGSLACAFFASLEKCSCIHLSTKDEDHCDVDEESEVHATAGSSVCMERVCLIRTHKAVVADEEDEDEAESSWVAETGRTSQSWVEQTLPFVGSPRGMSRFS
ncbi:hypothetical protein KP509_34G072000 [Ceratopteris richardii]|nr:hypothetical protein KP509_34G072000 [Ceratopteris richardii]